MHNILMIIRREYRERVTKKSFWIGTAIFPLLMVGFSFLPMLLIGLGGNDQKTIALVDGTGKLRDRLVHELADEKLKDGKLRYVVEDVPVGANADEARKPLEQRVRDKQIYGILQVSPDIEKDGAFQFYARTVGDIKSVEEFHSALRRAVVSLRFENAQIAVDKSVIQKITAPVDMQTNEVSNAGGSTKKGFTEAYFGTFMFVLILFMTLLLYGIAMMRGILEEKSSRVMEVLLGSVSPNELMTGKILGIGLVGLTQVAIYALTAGAVRIYFASQANAEMAGFLSNFTGGKMAFFLIFFLLGYFIYTAMFACIGAVCNSEQEAQNLQQPVQMCLMLPMMATIFFVGQPDSTISVIVSLIPIFTPMVMFMRICVQMPPMWQIVLSIVLTTAATWVLFRGAAKIFRIGILMYGKRPTIPEILKWART
ncbi:MAG TPA: ABC transporter permease [Candidatus Polarisedimenticolaceae bacterium]|nr:ABC transporter permease [Candidatus Polarisedimenticolaceae bacterium]